MKKINYFFILLIIFLLIKIFYNQYDIREQKKYDRLKIEYNILKDSLTYFEKFRNKEKDSLFSIIKEREKENKKYLEDSRKTKEKILSLKKEKIIVPTKKDFASYFNTRYNTNKNKVVENYIFLDSATAYNTIYELEAKHIADSINILSSTIINQQDSTISNLFKNNLDLEKTILSAEIEISKREELQKRAEENIKNLEKRNKTLAIKSQIFISSVFIIGGVLGYIIAK